MECDLCGNESNTTDICQACITAIENDQIPTQEEFMIELGIEYLASPDLDEDFKCAIAEEVYFSEPSIENLRGILDIASKNSDHDSERVAKRLHLLSEIYISIHSKILSHDNMDENYHQLQILHEAAKGVEIQASAMTISQLNHDDISFREILSMPLHDLIGQPDLVAEVTGHVSHLIDNLKIHFQNRDNYSSRIFYYAYQLNQDYSPFLRRLNNKKQRNIDLPKNVLMLKSHLETLESWHSATYDILTGHPSRIKFSEEEETMLKPVSDDDLFWSLETRFSWLTE